MTQQEFDNTRWHKGMKALVTIHTVTKGPKKMECDILGVNFECNAITVLNPFSGKPIHRVCIEIDRLIEPEKAGVI